MLSNQYFFLELKLTIIPNSDKISLKRHHALIGSFPSANESWCVFYTGLPHHHTAAPAFYIILADNVMQHLFVFISNFERLTRVICAPDHTLLHIFSKIFLKNGKKNVSLPLKHYKTLIQMHFKDLNIHGRFNLIIMNFF